jgi:hypothetical protein
LAPDFNRFQTTRRGYDPAAVEKELIALNTELVRLQNQNQDLNQQLKQTRLQLSQAEAQLRATAEPNFSALGSKAADLLATAEAISLELRQANELELDQIRLTTANELSELRQKAELDYQLQLEAATRRSARAIATAKHEAELLVAESKEKAAEIQRTVEREVAKLRGQAATEVAAIRTSATREIELKRAIADKELARARFLLAEEFGDEEKAAELAKTKLEAQFAERNRESEQEIFDKHSEAIRQTESYLESAKYDLAELQQAAALTRLEIQALELDAGRTQANLIQEARQKAEAILHAAEQEASAMKLEAKKQINSEQKQAKIELKKIENRVAASEIYLENLRSVVTKEVSAED